MSKTVSTKRFLILKELLELRSPFRNGAVFCVCSWDQYLLPHWWKQLPALGSFHISILGLVTWGLLIRIILRPGRVLSAYLEHEIWPAGQACCSENWDKHHVTPSEWLGTAHIWYHYLICILFLTYWTRNVFVSLNHQDTDAQITAKGVKWFTMTGFVLQAACSGDPQLPHHCSPRPCCLAPTSPATASQLDFAYRPSRI